jgi:hypothetical protein
MFEVFIPARSNVKRSFMPLAWDTADAMPRAIE